MPDEGDASAVSGKNDRIPPFSEEAERGVLGAVLLDAVRVVDLCVERSISPESFYVPAHRDIFLCALGMNATGRAVDVLTLSEQLKDEHRLDRIGGVAFLNQLIDSTPTAAHAEYYIDIVSQKHLLRSIITCARRAEQECYSSLQEADLVLSHVEQEFLNITENQHGSMTPWPDAVKAVMAHVENVLMSKSGVHGLSTGYRNLDAKLLGLKGGELSILAARPSMGKTSLAMNIAENVALGKLSSDGAHPVGIFSLEMSQEALLLRMLCSHAGVNSFKITSGYVGTGHDHGLLTQAASALSKAPIYLDDTGGLDVLELRARARRMKVKYDVKLIVVDYLQLLHSKEYSRQGLQVETSQISGQLKAMAKELKIPVLVLSQLSRAPETRDKLGRPKLSDLRDSGAIEQDADVVLLLRRPSRYEEDPEHDDTLLSVVDVAKHRNGPTGEIRLNFEEEYTRFRDRAGGVDDADVVAFDPESEAEIQV
ncbi:MAG: replicative DNA helicase [Verrucomicrobia bacterium]|nr:replicative DNA helicase [Verrucomicrobiota bacterium]MDA1087955.1 replicative DNA helicase [Verrucomicrobiota bacterium]